jgi:hypothetical protein
LARQKSTLANKWISAFTVPWSAEALAASRQMQVAELELDTSKRKTFSLPHATVWTLLQWSLKPWKLTILGERCAWLS